MIRPIQKTTLALLLSLAVLSCNEDDDAKPDLRADMDYSTLNSQSDYSAQFKNAEGISTVDLSEGNNLHRMFQALNYYSSSRISANTQIDATGLKNQYANTGSPFVDISTATISVTGATLNSSGLQLKSVTASSLQAAQADVVRAKIEAEIDALAASSLSITQAAAQGQAGKAGSYLVDANGIERIQIIQKSLIGALQLDYISNVLLDEGLDADNHSLVSGNVYSPLEHNWDQAYGLLTLNPVYLYNTTTGESSTDESRKTVEFALGSYIWEYNKSAYPQMSGAFLKGRAAIVNNDRTELETQATFIRTEMEKALANAAIGYLAKWKVSGATVPNQIHAMGEGLGFIYSLRFATIHGADAAWSDEVINGLVGSTNGFWDLDVTKINTASDAIKAKFGL